MEPSLILFLSCITGGGCKRKKTIADPTGEGKRKKRKREEHEGDSVFSNGTNSTTSSYLSSKRHKSQSNRNSLKLANNNKYFPFSSLIAY